MPEPYIEQAVNTASDIKETVADWYVENTSITYEDTQKNATIQKRLGNDSGGKSVKTSPKSNVGKGRT